MCFVYLWISKPIYITNTSSQTNTKNLLWTDLQKKKHFLLCKWRNTAKITEWRESGMPRFLWQCVKQSNLSIDEKSSIIVWQYHVKMHFPNFFSKVGVETRDNFFPEAWKKNGGGEMAEHM